MSFSDNGIVPAAARTSETDPLYISELTNGNLTIGITMLPGRKGRSMTGPEWDRDLETDMAVINAWGAEHVVLLLPALSHDIRNETGLVRNWPHASIREALTPSMSVIYTGLAGIPNEFGARTEDTADRIMAGRKRILLISERGLESTGTVAAIILRRAGVDVPDAIAMVNACRPGSITTIAQRELILSITRRDSIARYLKRESQPPGIIVAKHMADLLRKSSGMTQSAALEAYAVGDGWKNWSTMSAALSGPGRPYPGDDQGRARLHQTLGLDSGSATSVSERIIDICGLLDHRDRWKRRASVWLEACVAGLFDLHARSGTAPSYETLRSAIDIDSPVGFIVMVRAYEVGGLSGPGMETVRKFAEMLPGFSNARAVEGVRQDHKTMEQAGFLSMYIRCQIDRINFDITGRE